MSEDVQWVEKADLQARAAELVRKDVSIVLDVGSGIRPQQIVNPDVLICVEPRGEYVQHLKLHLRQTHCIVIQMDARTALAALPDQSVDSIFLIDVIEHVTKDVGRSLLRDCGRIARCQIVVFTPLGFIEQHPDPDGRDAWNLHGGEWQSHKSGWYPEDFRDWVVLASPDFHTDQVPTNAPVRAATGHEVRAPVGAFYAIKNLSPATNLFNPIYSKALLDTCTDRLRELHAALPEFVSRYVWREIERAELRSGTRACHFATEALINAGDASPGEDILKAVNDRRAHADLQDATRFPEMIRSLAAEFLDANVRQAYLDERDLRLTMTEAELRQSEADLRSRLVEVSGREEDLAKRSADLNGREADLNAREADLNAREAEQRLEGDVALLLQQHTELLAEVRSVRRQNIINERSCQDLIVTVDNIMQSRIWKTLANVGGVLLRVSGRRTR